MVIDLKSSDGDWNAWASYFGFPIIDLVAVFCEGLANVVDHLWRIESRSRNCQIVGIS